MTLEELKIRQLTNQYLLAPADKLTVMRDLCGVQAQFMTNALHSLKIRTNDYDEQTVAEGLVKNWSVRGTVHVFAESDPAAVYPVQQRRRLSQKRMAGIFLYEKSAPVLGFDARTSEISCGYHHLGGCGEGIHARRAEGALPRKRDDKD